MKQKVYVLASSYGQFRAFCQFKCLNPYSDAVYIKDDWDRLLGLNHGEHRPLFILEGYEYNPAYTVGMVSFLNFFCACGKFEPFFLSEGEMYR